MKKMISTLSVGVLMFSLAACGQQSVPQPESPSPTAAPVEVAAPAMPGPEAESAEVPADANESFPDKPVEATVQWAAGGGGDMVFRILAEVFPKYANGQPLVIKNVEGASGVTGTTEFIGAAADGYKVMHWNNAHVSKVHMDPVPYDNKDTFDPVLQVVESSNYLLVSPDARWASIQEFVDEALANPGTITIANAGVGGGNHMAALLFEDAVGAEFSHVAYSGGGPAVTGLLSNEVDAAMCNSPEGMSNVESGQAKILVSFGSKPFEAYPDVPIALDEGLDLVIEQWRGVMVPKGTPKEEVDRLHDIFKQCIEDEVYISKIKELGATPAYKNTEDFRKFIEEEDARFENLIRSKGFGNRY